MKKNKQIFALIVLLCAFQFCNNPIFAQVESQVVNNYTSLQETGLAYTDLNTINNDPIKTSDGNSPTEIDSVSRTEKDECKIEEELKQEAMPAPLSCSISGPTMICSGQSTTLTASFGYSYLWSNGAVTQSITVFPATTTTYLVTVTSYLKPRTDSYCSVTVTVNPTASITGTNAVCAGNSTTLTASGGGTSYLWSPGGATASSITVTPSTTTIYRVTVTYSGGCTSTALRAVSVTQYPTVTITGLDSICAGNSASLVSHCFVSGTYLWSTGQSPNAYYDISQSPREYLTNISVSPTSSTVYSVTATAGPGCTASASHLVTVNPTTVGGSVTGGTTICSGSTSALLTLSGRTGNVVRWEKSVSPFTTWIPIINTNTTYTSGALTATTQFRAMVKSGVCDSAYSAAATVTVNPLPTATVGSNSPVCAGTTLTLTSSGGTSYSWSGPNSFTSSVQNPSIASATTAATGTYTVTVTNANGCSSTAQTTTTVKAQPTATAGGSQTICVGSLATVIGATSSNGTILWTHNGSGTLTNTKSLTPTYTSTEGDAGNTVTLTMTVTNSPCPAAIATYTIEVKDKPKATAGGSQTICVGSETTVSGATSSNGTILWTHNGSGTLANATTLAPTYTSAAGDAGNTVTLTMTVTNSPCPAAIATYIIEVKDKPTATAGGSQTICVGSGTTVSGATKTNGTILWTHNGSGTLTNATTLTPTYTSATGDGGNTVTLTMTVSNNLCSAATATYTVVVNALPTATTGSNSPICSGNTLNLTSSGGSSYSWSGPNFTSTSQNPTIANATVAASGTYTVTVTGTGNCTSTAHVLAIINAKPTAIAESNSPICSGTTLNLTSSGGVSYSWSGPNHYTSTAQNPSIPSATTSASGTYTVTVTNLLGCTLTAQVVAVVNTLPTAIAGNNSPICTGTTLNLTSSGGEIYSWSGPNNFASSDKNPSIPSATTSASGVYTVTVTNSNGCTSTAETTVTIDPATIGGSVTGGTTICSGGTSAVLTLTGYTGTIVKWLRSTDGITWTGFDNTAPTFTSEALTQTTQFRAVVQSGVCSDVNSEATIVTVDPTTIGGSITGGTSICTGSTSGILTLADNIGTILKWQSSIDGSTWTDIANTANTYSSGVLSATTQFRAVVQSGVCAEANSSTITVTVNPITVGGSITGGTTVCSGSTSALLELTGYTGTILKWQSSTDGTTWTDIINTASTYTSGALTTTTEFRAVVQSGSCESANSASTTVTVDPATIGGMITGGTSICSGNTSAVLRLVGYTGTIIKWQSSIDGTTWVNIANTSDTYTSGILSTTTQFRAVVQSGDCAEANSSIATVTVSTPTVEGTVTGGTTICSGSPSELLTLADYIGTIVRWESSVSPFTTWSSIANTVNTYRSTELTESTQFRAVVQSGTCGELNSGSTTVIVEPKSVGGFVTGGTTICSGSTSGLLTLGDHIGTIVRWESSVSPFTTWSSITNSANTYTSDALVETTQFRAVVQSGVCAEVNSAATTVIVNSISIGGSVTGGTTICTGSTSGLLTLDSYTGTIVRWESSISPYTIWTPIVNATTTYISGALTATTQFRAVVQNENCPEANSTTTTIIVSQRSIGGSVTGGTTICSGSTSGELTLTGYAETIVKWQKSSDNGMVWTDIANTTNTYTSGALSEETEFRAVVQSGSCAIANSVATLVTIDPVSVGGFLSASATQIYLGQTTGAITLSEITGTVVKWQKRLASGTWTDITNTASTYSETPNVVGIWEYRAVVQSGACAIAYSAIVSIEVLASSAGAVTGGTTPICLGTSTGDMTLGNYEGTIVKWQKSSDNGTIWTDIANITTTYSETPLVAGIWLYRGVVNNNGSDIYSAPTIIEVNPLTIAGSVSGNTSICMGNTSFLTLSDYSGDIIKWQSSIDGTIWTDIANTTIYFATGVLTQTMQFRAVVQSGSCPAANSEAITVTVNALPTLTIGSNSPVCAGASLNLNVSGTIYNWSGPNGFNSTQQQPTLQNVSTKSTGTYTVTVYDVNNCSSTGQILVQIYARPLITNTVNNLICDGETIRLLSNGGVTYSWTGPNSYTSNSPINLISNADHSYNGVYTVVVNNDHNCASSATSIVQVSDNPVVDAGTDVSICYGATASLTASGGNSYLWNNGESTSSIMVSPFSTTTYSVEGKNTTGCTSVDQVIVTVSPPLSPYTLNSTPSNCAKGGIIKLSGSEVGISYQLFIGDVSIGDPQVGTGEILDFGSVSANGTYTIKATRISDNCERIMNGSFIVN